MELKVWVEGIQRIVCGVTEKTTCQDVVYALAHATGKTGRFTLIERWRNNERLLAPQEHPLKVLQKWGEYSPDVQFILQRSALDGTKNAAPPNQQKKPLVWKPPPNAANSRLSPDSGRGSGNGSDRTGSDTSNSYSGKEARSAAAAGATSKSTSSLQQYGQPAAMAAGSSVSATSLPGRMALHSQQQQQQQQQQQGYPPAYRPPPSPMANGQGQQQQPGGVMQPPPYRPPPAPNASHPAAAGPYPPATASQQQQQPHGHHYPGYASRQPAMGVAATTAPSSVMPPNTVRPPHYSPPPTHRNNHLSRHPSKSSLVGSASSRMNQHGLPSRQHAQIPSSRVHSNAGHQRYLQHHTMPYQQGGQPPADLAELVSLVSAQQSTLYSQQAEIKQCDAEAQFLEHQYYNGRSISSASTASSTSSQQPQQDPSQIELVLSEVRRLEEVSSRNDEELQALSCSTSLSLANSSSSVVGPDPGNLGSTPGSDAVIQSEISQLKARLAGTDQELQKTNTTLKRLGDEMRSMSLEKSRQREQELRAEIDRLQAEIKNLQKSSEEGANISQKLSQEVKDVEEQISARKAEVEKLIKEMREANMESLAISPPEESKQFLDGPMKPGTARKMMGSPRALENAVPTAKNPHGVWV